MTGFGQVSNARSSSWPRLVNATMRRGARLDVPDEEPDVGAGDERLAAPGDHDAVHRGIAGGRVERLFELRDDLFVERVHRVGPVDRQRRDPVVDLRSHEREAERPARASLLVERRRQGRFQRAAKRRDELLRACDPDWFISSNGPRRHRRPTRAPMSVSSIVPTPSSTSAAAT